MADEFQAGVCAENWWTMNLPQNSFGSSICSPISNRGIFSWPSDFDMKTRTSDESGSANSEGSIFFQDIQKPINQDSVGLSSSITDWYQTLLHDSKRNASNCDSLNSSSINQKDANTVDYSQIKKDWSLENLSTIDEDSSIDAFKEPINQGFPVSSSLYGYPYSVIQTLFDTDSDQESVFGNGSMDYPAMTNNICQEKLNEFSSSSFLKPNSLVLPPKQQPLISHSYLPNNSTWNTSGDGLSTPVQSQILSPRFEDKLYCPNPSIKSNKERIREMSTVVMKNNNNTSEPEFKRTRIETPLPTFKVRKEKLGDRVTALQQLVSPFGKTDTASVLHEAIEYIKLLHDQVTVLITPCMKGDSFFQHKKTLTDPKGADQGAINSRELRSRGLCLVPISSTFPVAAETTADFWTPTFGGSYR